MNINTFTAKGYTIQQRLIGLFVSYGSLLAILLELGLISAGFTLKGSSLTTNIFQITLWGVAGLLVGLLVVKMSLTNATKLRSSLDKEEQLRADYQKRARELVTIPQSVQDALSADIADTKKGRFWIYFLLALGCGFSIVCEAIVMSLLFASINPTWAGDLLSLFLSTLVTFTMVSGEMHKVRDQEIIKHALSHNSFLELAAKASVYDAFNKKMIAEAATHVQEILDNDVLQAYARSLVYASIEEHTGQRNFESKIEEARERRELQCLREEDENRRLLARLRGDTEPSSFAPALQISEENIHTEPSILFPSLQSHQEFLKSFETPLQSVKDEVNAFEAPLQSVKENVNPFEASLQSVKENVKRNNSSNTKEASVEPLYISKKPSYGDAIMAAFLEDPTRRPEEIAQKLGCSLKTVYTWRNRVLPPTQD